MQPATSTKLAEMGDINANKKKLEKAIEFAKKNPDHPDAVELRRRLERGMFNTELKALGKKPFPVEQPKIDLSAAMLKTQQTGLQTKIPEAPKQGSFGPFDVGTSMASLKERGGDIKEAFMGVGKQLWEGGKDIVQTAKRDDRNLAEKAVMIGGRAFGAGAGAFGEATAGIGKLALTQDAEDSLKNLAAEVAQGVSETAVAKKAADWYDNLDPLDKDMLNAVGGFASVLAELVGVKGSNILAKGAKETIDVAAPVIKQTMGQAVDVTGDVLKKGADTTAGIIQKAVTPSPEVVTQRINDAVGRIIQGKPEDIAAARRVLQAIDTAGVEDYAGLNKRFDQSIEIISKQVDSELGKFNQKFKPEQTGLYKKVGEETVTSTPVMDAFDGLENAYKLSGDVVREAKLRQLKKRFETDGLTVKELNDLAREYGIEFKDKAFTKLGDPKPGYNAENFEAVRRGLKEVTRERMPNNVTKELDRQLSDLYDTKGLTEKMEVQVQKLYQKVKNRTLAQKVGGAVADVVDLASFGTLRGFVQKLLPSNVGLKTANSLDLQKELTKNLATIEKLNKIEDPAAFAKAFEAYMSEAQPGMSIRSTVTPAKVAANIDAGDVELVRRFLNGAESPEIDRMLQEMGIFKTTREEQEKFLKDMLIEAEQMRGLKNITSQKGQVNESFNQGATPQTTKLVEEAKKYKSAEEFVKSKTAIYHATDAEFDEFKPSMNADEIGTWFAPDSASVKSAEYPIVMERYIKPNTKLITETELSKLENTDWFLDQPDVETALLAKGFKGIKFDDGVVQLLRPNEDTVTRTQLEEVWKKANKSTSQKGPTLNLKDKNIVDADGDPITDISKKIQKGVVSHSSGPVEVIRTSDGSIVVLDGQHRINDALNAGKTNIDVKYLTPEEAFRKYNFEDPTN